MLCVHTARLRGWLVATENEDPEIEQVFSVSPPNHVSCYLMLEAQRFSAQHRDVSMNAGRLPQVDDYSSPVSVSKWRLRGLPRGYTAKSGR